jgi:hypothetical protein
MTTSNYALNQPKEGSRSWDAGLNSNLDVIGSKVASLYSDRFAVRDSLAAAVTGFHRPLGYNMDMDYWQRGYTFAEAVAGNTEWTADLWRLKKVSGTGNTAVSGITPPVGWTKTNNRVAEIGSAGTDEVLLFENFIPNSPKQADFVLWAKGKTFTFAVDIEKGNSASVVRTFIKDGGTEGSASIDGGTNNGTATTAAVNTDIQRLLVTHTVSSDATELSVGVEYDANGVTDVCNVGQAVFAAGTFTSLPYIPINPQDDLFGCSMIYQKIYATVGWFGKSANHDYKATLVYPFPMLDTPTASITAGTATKGTATSRAYIPDNEICGHLHVVGNTVDGNGVFEETDIIIQLEVK